MVPYLVRGPDGPREGKGDEDREDNRLKRRLEVLARVDLVDTSSLGEEQLHNVEAQHLTHQGRRAWAARGLGCGCTGG